MCATQLPAKPVALPDPYLPISVDLGPTAAYKSRKASWVAFTDPRADYDGILTLTVRRSPGVVDTDSYAVQEQREQPFAPWREFLLLNLTDSAQPDVYRTCVGPRGVSCTCKASQCKLACKHTGAIVAIIDAGGLPSRNDEPPAPPAPPKPAPAPVKPAPVVCPICGSKTDGERAHKLCVRYQWGHENPEKRQANDDAWREHSARQMARVDAGLDYETFVPPHPIPTELPEPTRTGEYFPDTF
jgi:hypothetical protein